MIFTGGYTLFNFIQFQRHTNGQTVDSIIHCFAHLIKAQIQPNLLTRSVFYLDPGSPFQVYLPLLIHLVVLVIVSFSVVDFKSNQGQNRKFDKSLSGSNPACHKAHYYSVFFAIDCE